ncbi:MAG: ABC transporter substrate-binding protein [Ilumatobacteraceae bacterium]
MTAKDQPGSEVDASSLALDELRALRADLQQQDDVVSYVRRLAQARLDFVRAEMRNRAEGTERDITDEIPHILGTHLTGGAARPPRPADDFSTHPLAVELEELCDDACSTDLPAMSHEELATYASRLHDFEQLRSNERRDLFVRLDALSAELVRRYRDGEANVDGLLVD